MTRWIITALVALMLAGCASSSPAPQRYTLPLEQTQAGAGADADHLLLMRQPRLANYLDVDGIVMQLDDITLVEARGHQWAEALGRQLERGLRARLTTRLPDTRVMLDEGGSRDPGMSLRLEVDRFQGRHDGLAIVGGQWQLRDADGVLLDLERFEVAVELEADGYPALVRALGTGWDRVADQLADTIQRLR
ncbi:PqiC family protein [Halomonas urumqiensis]|uniref:ABC-type transport auxiliary lipoprotein component domain-containing protein n=1 Tax=Halomonas urumqiensis TaxID=1684789 RepID=A0A2N7UPV6_9GAMM|nr:ABC-type transport auxiliary lipoprotein family protein [Halomonas urumqiensis]PMR82465.1 hypothetical protein C1H70_01740 [Halomonas urumqiensis]PTB04054.1 hypothetical protein C6V82_06260 [Halomonas urumqiensis]GHE19685.1 hypothetical protein GCM10017767_02060 [Halomonas urumqiensis]